MLVLTYNPNHTDGFGAQYQRILGIYSICKHYNIKYHHTPFLDIEYQGLNSLILNKNEQSYIDNCRSRTEILSDVTDFNNFQILDTDYIDIHNLRHLIDMNTNILLRVKYPYRISDYVPNIYRYCINLYKTTIQKNTSFTIGLHVRRGELYVVDGHRMLPNEYYINIVNKIILPILNKFNITFIIELYTEVPSAPTVITGSHVGIKNRIDENITICPSLNSVEDFYSLPNLVKCINEDTLVTFDKMINCNILIASRSSLSACASYLKNDGLTIYHKFWHTLSEHDIEREDPNIIEKITNYVLKFVCN